MTRTQQLILGLLAGFALLAGVTWYLVQRAQGQAVAEALEEQGMQHEEHLLVVIRALEPICKTLPEMGQHLVAIAREHPALLDFVVLDSSRNLVRRYTRDGNAMPCAAAAPLRAAMNHVHASDGDHSEVACRSLPVSVGDETGLILFHAERDWRMDGERVGGWVRQTALRVAPIYVVSYFLMGLMLVLASRRIQKWRAQAESHARVEALGAIATGIDHEIKNPLNTVGLSLQFLRRKHEDEETREVVDSASREARRISDTLQTFARFTRVSRLSLDPAEIGALVEQAAVKARVGCDIDGSAHASVDAERLAEALADMLAVFPAGNARLSIRIQEAGSHWRMELTGPQPDVPLDRMFDPYLRTTPRDIGHGLALARAVFQAHGGALTAHARGGQLTLKSAALRRPVAAPPIERT